MTSSARASTVGGIVRPRVFAVASRPLLGCPPGGYEAFDARRGRSRVRQLTDFVGRLGRHYPAHVHRARDHYFPCDGYMMMKFDRLGIITFGNVWAFISSFSPMIPLRLSRYAVTAYTSSSLSDCDWR